MTNASGSAKSRFPYVRKRNEKNGEAMKARVLVAASSATAALLLAPACVAHADKCVTGCTPPITQQQVENFIAAEQNDPNVTHDPTRLYNSGWAVCQFIMMGKDEDTQIRENGAWGATLVHNAHKLLCPGWRAVTIGGSDKF
jgi:hypothetical protein